MRPRHVVPLLAIIAFLSTGCSVADPDTSQKALHYKAGPFSSQNFASCVEPGIRDVSGANDIHYYYPNGQRTYTFRSNPDGTQAAGADAPAIRVSTSNQIELLVSGTVTFALNTDCRPHIDPAGKPWAGGPLQRFHDTIGRHNDAFTTGNGGQLQPEGWRNVLALYVGGPAERAMDNSGLAYSWQALYSDLEQKNEWTEAVETAIPDLIREQAGDDHFVIANVQIDKPNVPQALLVELEARAAALERQETANQELAFANNFPGGLAGYAAYQRQIAETKVLNEGRGLLIPPGSSAIVPAQPGS